MRKALWLLLYAAYFTALCVFTVQEASTGHADARYLLVALGTLPLWGIPLVRKIYRRLSRRRR